VTGTNLLFQVEQVSERYGRLDVLVNNAAVYEETPPLSSSLEAWTRAWRKALEVNVMGPAVLIWAAAQLMARDPAGACAPPPDVSVSTYLGS